MRNRTSKLVFLAGGVGALVAAPSLAQLLPQASNGGSASPVSGGQTYRPAIGDDERIAPPNHPPFDQIPPMPMPEEIDLDFDGEPEGLGLHDATTGETLFFPFTRHSTQDGAQGPGFIGADGFDSLADLYMPEGFGTMSLISDASRETFPWRANCKLIIRFVDLGGANRYFACSGTMVDPGIVLTAGHCVYARDVTGTDIFDWAEEMWVYPGWDGVTGPGVFTPPDGDDVIENWGWTRATGFVSSVGANSWTQDGNFDYDVGLGLCYDRSVGMITGWFGWAWGGSCATIQGRTYNNASYPAEGCGGGLHTGTNMYYWSGSVDACVGANRIEITTTPGCLTAVWGGMSGSSAYYIDASDRFAHAVCSTSDRATYGRYAKLWDNFVNGSGGLLDQMNNVRGSGLDLEALQFRSSGSTTVQAGTGFGGATFTAANSSNNNPPAQTYTVRVYLSSNNNISVSDTLLATWNYSPDFAALQNITFNVPSSIIPITTTPGTYWLGVEFDPATDVNSGNNDSDTWDAQQITVTLGLPDAPSGPFPADNATGVSPAADLDWSNSARASSYDVYFGTDSTPDASEFVGNTASSGWALPNLAPNTHYYWQIVARNSTGTATGPVWDFTTQTPADLNAILCNAPDAPNNIFYRGQTMNSVTSQVRNDGQTTSSTYALEWRASTNNIISAGDLLLRSENFAALGAGSTRTAFRSVTLPGTMNPGTYFIGNIVLPSDGSGSSSISDTNTIIVRTCAADISSSADPRDPLYGVPDASIDASDFFYYLDLFTANRREADLTGSADPNSPDYGRPDGIIDASDFFYYLDLFTRGCPGL